MEELSPDHNLNAAGHITSITYLIRARFPGVSGLVHISKSEEKVFLDLLGDDVTVLDLAELAGLESSGDRPIDRLDRVASVCTEMHADVIDVQRVTVGVILVYVDCSELLVTIQTTYHKLY